MDICLHQPRKMPLHSDDIAGEGTRLDSARRSGERSTCVNLRIAGGGSSVELAVVWMADLVVIITLPTHLPLSVLIVTGVESTSDAIWRHLSLILLVWVQYMALIFFLELIFRSPKIYFNQDSRAALSHWHPKLSPGQSVLLLFASAFEIDAWRRV